ncbi:hypothetical protein AVEN_236013-1 [Araneus ventricosus]|uniref:Uncharacterized protein n=1 Tax=Araneus ventricosus TaxID=182803 RepID=A0A4Y2MJC3_ARAVE|nr:hypothetical protein AVEN_236013-1 [Araneus ventricosus]
MGHDNNYRSKKRKFAGNRYSNVRVKNDSQTVSENVVNNEYRKVTASSSKLEGYKQNCKNTSRRQEMKLKQPASDAATESMRTSANNIMLLKGAQKDTTSCGVSMDGTKVLSPSFSNDLKDVIDPVIKRN